MIWKSQSPKLYCYVSDYLFVGLTSSQYVQWLLIMLFGQNEIKNNDSLFSKIYRLLFSIQTPLTVPEILKS